MSQPAVRVDRNGVSLGMAVGAFLGSAAWILGLGSLSDNSFLTHLATGRLILESGSVPSVDAYTFTAAGEPWVVQSWLPSWLYATAEALWGDVGLRVITATFMAAVMAAGWRLTSATGSLVARLALGSIFLVVGSGLWSERPLLVGLIGLGVVALVVEDRLPALLLIPVGWIWVNSHGSFPLAFAYLAAVGVGRRLDRDPARPALVAGGWLSVGVLLGAVGPLGPRALAFPLHLLRRQEVLSRVVEWQAPSFQSLSQRAFLLQLLVAIVLVGRRPSYRAALVTGLAAGIALVGLRNLPVASLLLLPTMASAVPDLGALRVERRGLAARVGLVAALAVGGIGTVAQLDRPGFQLARYPVDAYAFLEERGLMDDGLRVAAPDIVGNFVGVVYGAEGDVFVDDRFDMFPTEVLEDHLVLVDSGPSVRTVLDRYRVDAVVWRRAGPLSGWLVSDPSWRIVHLDEQWVVSYRRQHSSVDRR